LTLDTRFKDLLHGKEKEEQRIDSLLKAFSVMQTSGLVPQASFDLA